MDKREYSRVDVESHAMDAALMTRCAETIVETVLDLDRAEKQGTYLQFTLSTAEHEEVVFMVGAARHKAAMAYEAVCGGSN